MSLVLHVKYLTALMGSSFDKESVACIAETIYEHQTIQLKIPMYAPLIKPKGVNAAHMHNCSARRPNGLTAHLAI